MAQTNAHVVNTSVNPQAGSTPELPRTQRLLPFFLSPKATNRNNKREPKVYQTNGRTPQRQFVMEAVPCSSFCRNPIPCLLDDRCTCHQPKDGYSIRLMPQEAHLGLAPFTLYSTGTKDWNLEDAKIKVGSP